MAARIGIEGRDAHQPVHAGLGLEPAIGVLALDQDGRRLDARLFAVAFLDQLPPCSRASRPSACTCAAASRPSPGSRCRRRRHGSRDSRRCASASPDSMRFELHRSARSCMHRRQRRLRPRRRWPCRPRPRQARSARWFVEFAFERRVAPRAIRRAAWRSRISVCARCGSFQKSRGFGLGVQFVQTAVARCPSQRCLLSRPSDCLISSTALVISARIRSSDRG